MKSQSTETKSTTKRRSWLIILIAIVAVTAITIGALWVAGVFNSHEETPNTDTPDGLAKAFVKAYCLNDMPTYFPLCLYDARQEWEDRILKDHKTEEAFCQVVQQQAMNQGLDYTVNSFDDYLTATQHRMLTQMEETYGKYTIKTSIEKQVKMDEELLQDFRDKLKGGFLASYYDEAEIDAISEVYTFEIGYSVEGEKKDHYESYVVYTAYVNDRWVVANHTL